MQTYLILVAGLSLSCFIHNKRVSLLLSFLFLFFVGGLRDSSVGTDSENYLMLFNEYGDNVGSLHHANEPLYMILQLLCVLSGLGYGSMIIFSQVIILLTLCVVIYKWSYHSSFSLLCYFLLYFFFYSLNTMRQYMAIPFVLLSYYYLSQGLKKKYFLCMAIATMFHFSALISIVVLLAYKLNLKRHQLTLLLLITFVIGLTPLSPMITQLIGGKISIFAGYSEKVADYRSSLFSLSRLLLNIYAFIIIYWLRDKDKMISIFIIGVCMLNLFSFQPVIGRMAQYFTIIQIVFIPNIHQLAVRKNTSSILAVGSFAYMIVTWTYLISANIGGVVPWKYGGFL